MNKYIYIYVCVCLCFLHEFSHDKMALQQPLMKTRRWMARERRGASRKFEVGRRSYEDNQVKQIRHQDIQRDVPRHRERHSDGA